MKKNKLLILGCCSIFSFGLNAQEVTPEVLSSAGEHFESSSVHLSWTIGEIATETLSTSNSVLTQGFHQPTTNTVKVSTNTISDISGINVFPNPVLDKLNIEFGDQQVYVISLYDAQGKLVKSINNNADQFSIIDVSSLSEGMYNLVIQNVANQQLTNFKIVK